MEAAVGFEVAGDVGQHRHAGAQGGAVGQCQGRMGVRLQRPGIDPLMQLYQFVLVGFGMQAVLPAGRGDALVAVFQVEQVQGVAGADARGAVQVQGEFRVEVRIGPMGVVVELAEVDQPSGGECLLGVERFPPTGVGQDDVRPVSPPLEVQEQAKNLLPMQDRIFERAYVGMSVVAGGSVRRVAQQGYAGQPRRLVPGDGQHLDAGLFTQAVSNMAELPWEVLVDEQDTHQACLLAAASNTRISRSRLSSGGLRHCA